MAQAVAVKAIRFEVREHTQEFTSLLSQSYKLIAFLHSKLHDEDGEATILPSLRNIAETLNQFYKERYTTNNPSFTG